MLIFPSYSHHIPIEDLLTTSETARRTCHGGEPTWAPPSFRGLSMDGVFLRKSIGNTMVLSWNIVYRDLYRYIHCIYIYTIIYYIYRTLPYGSGKFSHHPIQLDGLLLKKRQLHLLFLRLSSGICLACFACSMVEQLHTFRMFRFRKDETANSPMFSRDVVVS